MFSIIALEKFAQTTENKVTIQKKFASLTKHPLLLLEEWSEDCHNFTKRQVGFCAQWCLDNICELKQHEANVFHISILTFLFFQLSFQIGYSRTRQLICQASMLFLIPMMSANILRFLRLGLRLGIVYCTTKAVLKESNTTYLLFSGSM